MSNYLDSVEDKKAEMRSILEKVKEENRGLSDSERSQLESIKSEITMLEYRMLSEKRRNQSHDATNDVKKRFVEAVCDSVESGTQKRQELRSINATSVVHDASVPVIYQELMQPLEKGLILDSLGAKVMYGVEGEPLWRYLESGEASVVGENVAVDDSQLIKSTPKRMAMSFAVSNRAIHQSNLDLYGVVMSQLGMGVARKLNSIAFSDAQVGSGSEIWKGPFVGLSGEQSITRAGRSGAISFDDIVALEHAVLNKMTDSCGYHPGYVMNYKTAQKLRTTPIVAGQSEMILKMYRDPKTGERWGEMNAHIVKFTNYVAEGTIYFGDFAYLGLPQYGNMRITVDPYSRKKENAVEFTLNLDMDIVKIRNEAFAVSKGS